MSLYFHSRTEAGQQLAQELLGYQDGRYDCSVIALSVGAVSVGEPIARSLNCNLSLLLSEEIKLPGESMVIGTVNQEGEFVYDSSLSEGEIKDYYGEFHGYIDDQKREKFARLNRLLGDGGFMDRSTLKDKVVILVSDGLKTGSPLNSASIFLKPIDIEKLIIATPVASVKAVDKMHVVADELHCLGVTENYINTKHYYDDNELPSREVVLEKMKNKN